MEHYVYVRSDDSNDIFQDNQVFKFKIHLKKPIILNGFWKVGLSEFHVKNQPNKAKTKIQSKTVLDVFSNFCKESIVDGEEKPLLRRMERNITSGWSYMFNPVIYIPVKHREIYEFEVVIKADDGTIPSFLQQPVRLTLHFKRYPFYADYEAI